MNIIFNKQKIFMNALNFRTPIRDYKKSIPYSFKSLRLLSALLG